MDWQPIETAPRDATEVLGVLSSTAANGTYGEGGKRTLHIIVFEEGRWQGDWPALLENECWAFTHWMPLPEAPR